MNQLTEMFEGQQLRIIDRNNEPWFVAKDVCDILEVSNPSKAVARLDEDERSNLKLGRQGEVNIVNEFGLYNLVLGSRKPEAKEFKRWITHKVIPSIRKTGSYQIKSTSKDAFEKQLIGVDYATRILRTDETSKIKMLEAAHKEHSVPTNHLPTYVDEEVTKSLTSLLRKNGYGTSAAKINTKLIELGILEIKERPSSKGGTKEFKSLTDYGLKFGKNLINPKSQKETQPHYYESTFSDLMELVQS